MCSKIKFLLKDGTKIASRQWGVGNSTKLLCFHGWLDNSNTFSAMAPYLAERGMEVTAVDLLGHGDSSHEKPVHFTQYVCVARQILESMKYDKINLVGHSMGGSVALMLAGTYPELVEKLILIESFGVMVRDADDAAAVLRKSIDAQLQHTEKEAFLASQEQETGKIRAFPDIETTIEARMAAVHSFPGKQFISKEAATALIEGGTKTVSDDDNRVVFTYDPRHRLPSMSYMTKGQVMSFFKGVSAPTLLLTGSKGWPRDHEATRAYKEILESHVKFRHEDIEGASHHLHLDPCSQDIAKRLIATFIEEA